jgi:hypothetical protein
MTQRCIQFNNLTINADNINYIGIEERFLCIKIGFSNQDNIDIFTTSTITQQAVKDFWKIWAKIQDFLTESESVENILKLDMTIGSFY